MKKRIGLLLVTLGSIGFFAISTEASAKTDMLRVYNPNSGEHFYTGVPDERDGLIGVGWKNEGTGWTAPSTGPDVYRLYNPNAGDHHYTMDAGERDGLVNAGWKFEGVGWYSDANQGKALLRLYNPNAIAGAHHYTTSTDEKDSLIAAGWKYEGISWYGVATIEDPTNNDNPEIDLNEPGTVIVNYINEFGATLKTQKYTGKVGEEYKIYTPNQLPGYIINFTELPKNGVYLETGQGFIADFYTDKTQIINFYYYTDYADVTIKFVNDTDGSILLSKTERGKVGSIPTFNVKTQIAEYEASGYTLVSNPVPDNYFTDNINDLSYTVHLKR